MVAQARSAAHRRAVSRPPPRAGLQTASWWAGARPYAVRRRTRRRDVGGRGTTHVRGDSSVRVPPPRALGSVVRKEAGRYRGRFGVGAEGSASLSVSPLTRRLTGRSKARASRPRVLSVGLRRPRSMPEM